MGSNSETDRSNRNDERDDHKDICQRAFAKERSDAICSVLNRRRTLVIKGSFAKIAINKGYVRLITFEAEIMIVVAVRGTCTELTVRLR